MHPPSLQQRPRSAVPPRAQDREGDRQGHHVIGKQRPSGVSSGLPRAASSKAATPAKALRDKLELHATVIGLGGHHLVRQRNHEENTRLEGDRSVGRLKGNRSAPAKSEHPVIDRIAPDEGLRSRREDRRSRSITYREAAERPEFRYAPKNLRPVSCSPQCSRNAAVPAHARRRTARAAAAMPFQIS